MTDTIRKPLGVKPFIYGMVFGLALMVIANSTGHVWAMQQINVAHAATPNNCVPIIEMGE